MSWDLFKRSLPRGLFGRSLVIIVTPVVMVQAVVIYMLLNQQWEAVTSRISRAAAAQIVLFVQSYEALGPERFAAETARLRDASFGLSPVIKVGEKIPETESPAYSILVRVFVRELALRINRPVWIDSESLDDKVDIRVQLDGAVMQIMAERKRVMSTNTHVWVFWMIGTSLVFLSIAIVFLRNQIRPIERLAAAADSYGKGRDVPDFRPSGATEVRKAALAFIDMRERISRFVQQRTDMLAGVSHDLRTPLTRMKLELAMMKDGPSVEALRGDLDEMEHMLEEYLAFARGQAGESAVPTDLSQLLHDVVANTQRKAAAKAPGKSITCQAPEGVTLEVRPNALRRCVVNLVENAVRHGKTVRVTLLEQGSEIDIVVEDDGPGIPAARREEAFRPFHRLDSGRSLETGGAGLGLAIALDIARGHGGDVVLGDSEMGGLKATVRLPV